MTVTNTNYSSIEEVWGESFGPPHKSKREKKKKIIDPICELYEQGNNSGYTENDLISYANDYFEKQDKGKNRKYQKSMNDLVTVFGNETDAVYHRERPSRHVEVNGHNDFYDTTIENEEDEDIYDIQRHKQKVNIEYAPTPTSTPTPRNAYKKKTYDDVEEYEDFEQNATLPSKFAFIDLLLYVVSGIILIFVMEQFVKIGLLLQ